MERPIGLAGIRARDWLVPLLALALAVVLGEAVAVGHPPALDQNLLAWVGRHITGQPQEVLVLVYRLTGKAFTPVLVLASILFLLLRQRWRDLILLCASTGGILLIVDVLLKPLFDRNRPPDPLITLYGRSFPSGHAAGSIALYVVMVVILSMEHPVAAGRWPCWPGPGWG